MLEDSRPVVRVWLSRGSDTPSLYHTSWGAGEPPWLEHVRLTETPSVPTGVRGEMTGGPGLTNTVMET